MLQEQLLLFTYVPRDLTLKISAFCPESVFMISYNYKASWFVLVTKYNKNYHVEEDEVGGTYGMNGAEEEHVQGTGRKPERKETTKMTKT
jgi:hypothetical protein